MPKSDLEQLAEWRTLGARYSEETVHLAKRVLSSGNAGDQGRRLTPSCAAVPC